MAATTSTFKNHGSAMAEPDLIKSEAERGSDIEIDKIMVLYAENVKVSGIDAQQMSSEIEPNRTRNFQWVSFPRKSNSIKQIELNQIQSIILCSIEFRN